jgi:transposase
MVIIGIDAHKRSHTLVACDEQGRKCAERTIGSSSGDHLAVVDWAAGFGGERLWAVEDCRHLSRRLERDLLAAGERTSGRVRGR